MSKAKNNIIAIDPGLKTLGIVVMSGTGALRYTNVITTNERKSNSQRLKDIEETLNDLLRVYRPRIMLLEATWRCERASFHLTHRVAQVCRRAAVSLDVRVFSIPATTVRQSVAGFGWSSKADVATIVCARYPALRVYRGYRRAWKDRYFHNMFDAMALGIYYLDTMA